MRAVLLLRGLQAGPAPERQLFSPLAESRAAPRRAADSLRPPARRLRNRPAGGLRYDEPGRGRARAEHTAPAGVPGQARPGRRWRRWGLRQPAPARPALLKGTSALKSPVPVERVVRRPEPEPPRPPKPVPEVRPVERPVEPPPPVAKPDPIPPVAGAGRQRPGRTEGPGRRPRAHHTRGRTARAQASAEAPAPAAAGESAKARAPASATAPAAEPAAGPIARAAASRRPRS